MSFTVTRHNAQPKHQIPASHDPEIADELASPFNESGIFELELTPASDYDNANQDTALDAIYDALQTHVTSNILEAAGGLGLDSSDTTAVRIVVLSIVRKNSAFAVGDLMNQYLAGNDIFYIRYRVQWKVTTAA